MRQWSFTTGTEGMQLLGSLPNIMRIGEDFPVRVREMRRKLIPFLKDALANGKEVFLKYDKLRVDGVLYLYSNETKQPVQETQ